MATLTPLLKHKVDELFLHWFSEVSTQKQLRQDLANIRGINISPPHSPRPCSPTGFASIGVNNRPNSPPIPPGSPTSTPRSPRRRTSSSISRKSSRKSFRQNIHEDRKGQLYPGCAKSLKQFYFPNGEPPIVNNNEDILKSVKNIFDNLIGNIAAFEDFMSITKVCLYYVQRIFLVRKTFILSFADFLNILLKLDV